MSRLITKLNIFEWEWNELTLIQNIIPAKKKFSEKRNAPVEPFDTFRRCRVMYVLFG